MKKVLLISILCIFLLQSCCHIFYDLLNEKKSYCDFSNSTENKNYLFDFRLGVREDLYKYKIDSLNRRLKFIFSITAPQLPLIKLNSISYTRKINKDTIPMKLYYESTYILPNTINKLPFILEIDSIGTKHLGFRIVAESSESFHETKVIYISYDIEYATILLAIVSAIWIFYNHH